MHNGFPNSGLVFVGRQGTRLIAANWLKFWLVLLLGIVSSPLIAEQSAERLNRTTTDAKFNISEKPIRIAIFSRSAPFSLVLPDGKIAGLYVDIWRAWSRVTGQKIIFVPGSYSDNINALKNNRADIHAGLFVNQKRRQWAVFSLPIDRVPTGLFFRGDSASTPPIESLVGKIVSVGKGSFQESFLKENYPQIKVVTYTSTAVAIDDLLQYKTDAIVSESANVNTTLAKLGINGALKQREQALFNNTAHALIPKSKQHLLPLINSGIRALPIDEIVRLEKRWLPGYPAYFEELKTSLVPSLSIEEQDWLLINNHFKLGVDPAWAPFEFFDKHGQYAGISAEYVAKLSKKMSVDLEPEKGLSWSQVIKNVQDGKLDILPGVAPSEERKKYLVFSKPYVSFPNVVVTRNNAEYAKDLDDLNGKIIAVVDGYAITELLQKNHPKLTLKTVQNISEGLSLVKDQKAFGYVDNFAVVSHYLNINKTDSLKVAIFTQYDDTLSFGVRKELKPLVSIINKALDSLSINERKEITNHWLTVQVNVGTDIVTILKWSLPTLVVLFTIIFFIWRSNTQLNTEIRRRIRVEAELADARDLAEKANLLKGDFLANMSHEIRTPMNAVIGMSHLLEETNLDAKQLEYIDTLNHSSASLLLLIDDILDISKMEAGKLELESKAFNLRETIKRIVHQVQVGMDQSSVRLVGSIDKDVPIELMGDEHRLGQILLNLAGNAAKFTKDGAIEIRVFDLSKEELTARERSQDKQIRLHFIVEDSGIGMSSTQIEKLFQTYSQADSSITREYGGTGLGLSICKSLCELMGGKIWVKSQLGKGSQFHFTAVFDRAISDNTKRESIPIFDRKNALIQLKDKRILLVDDNFVNLTIAKTMLVKSGMQVVTAINGQESIDELQNGHFDAVLMDVQMPVMDGYAATKVIRQNPKYRNLVIIGLSANVMKSDTEKGRNAGMDDYLGKPISLDKILEVLATHLI